MQGAVAVFIILIIIAIGAVLFRSGTKIYVTKDSPFMLINAKNKESIEYSVRRAVRLYPEYTIYISNRSDDPEMINILSALEADISNVRIINRKKITN